MKRTGFLVSAFLFLIASGWAFLSPVFYDPSFHQQSLGGGAPSPQTVVSQNAKTPTQLFLDAVPDGQTVTYDDFCKSVDSGLTSFIGWANPQTISRSGKHVTVTLAAAASKSEGNNSVNLDKTIEFDVDTNSSDLSISAMTGVKVTTTLLSNLELKQAILAVDAAGNTTVTCKLLVSRFLPYAVFRVKVDKDGNPVK